MVEAVVACKLQKVTVSLLTFKKGAYYTKTLLPVLHAVHVVRAVRFSTLTGHGTRTSLGMLCQAEFGASAASGS